MQARWRFRLEFVKIGMGGVALKVAAGSAGAGSDSKRHRDSRKRDSVGIRYGYLSSVEKAWPTGVLWPSPADLVRLAGTSALWVTVTFWPNTVICATRLAYRSIRRGTKSRLTPPAMPVIVSQAWSLVAVSGMLAASTCSGHRIRPCLRPFSHVCGQRKITGREFQDGACTGIREIEVALPVRGYAKRPIYSRRDQRAHRLASPRSIP